MKRGLAGMFIIIVVLLGTVAWVYQNNVRQAQLVTRESAMNEVRSNRIAVVRNIIEKTYEKTDVESRGMWAGFVRDKLGKRYGLEIAVDLDGSPSTVLIEDRLYGLSSRFVLPTTLN
ncbi:MAG: hypothetical protein WC759_05160 [Candidatus Micrarchaeia archaeon]|jgi:hypothetical protein